jgi:hypothetical protein
MSLLFHIMAVGRLNEEECKLIYTMLPEYLGVYWRNRNQWLGIQVPYVDFAVEKE